MRSRRQSIKDAAVVAGAAALMSPGLARAARRAGGRKSMVVSVADDKVLKGETYDPPVVHRMFDRGVRVYGNSPAAGTLVPWVEGYDRKVYLDLEFGTLRKYRELMGRNFTKDGTQREIFNSLTWLWMLIAQGNEKAKKYETEIRRLYTDYDDREGIKKIAEEVADMFSDLEIEDESRSYSGMLALSGLPVPRGHPAAARPARLGLGPRGPGSLLSELQ